MKKATTFLAITFFLFSLIGCEEVINVEVPSGTPKLVVDAFFEVYFTKNPVTAASVVKLYTSNDYFKEGNSPALGATVFITDTNNNTIINFSDNNNNGNYQPNTTFVPLNDVVYELTVEYQGKTYKATSKREKVAPFKEVVQGDKALFTGNETEIKVSFIDNELREDYYRFNFGTSLYTIVEDRFFNGSDYEFSFFYQEEEIELPTTQTVKVSGVSKDYFTYFRVLVSQSGQTGGGPFQTVPATLLGNIVNQNNKKDYALGYFIISDTDIANVQLEKKE